jgi:pectate lyase
VDFIWGYSKASLFEKSEIRSLGRSTSNNNGGYVLQARVEAAGDKGFVFLNSSLTGGEGPTGVLPLDGTHYLARSPGGTTTFDNIVFVNTKMGAHINASGWAGKNINSQPEANPATGTAITGWREYNTMDLNGVPLNLASRQFGYELSLAEVAGYCSRAQVFAAYNSGAGWNPLPDDNSDCVNVDGGVTNSSFSSSSASSENDSSASATTSSAASSSVSSEIVGGGSSSDASSSSSSAASATTIVWTPAFADFSAHVGAVASGNYPFNVTADPISVNGFNFFSGSAASLRLHETSDSVYAINYNGSSLRTEPTTLVEGTSGQVNPKQLSGAGGVSRFVSYPFTPTSNPITFKVTYSNASANYDATATPNGCLNGQIAIVDQSGKTWKVASACSNPEQSTITAIITDPTVSELFVLMSRNGDGGGGIRIWSIEITK